MNPRNHARCRTRRQSAHRASTRDRVKLGWNQVVRSHAWLGACVALTALGASESDWWSFQPVRPPSIPVLAGSNPARHPIDALLAARLAEKGLEMNPEAAPRELVRRAFYDLVGLPPTPEEVDRFIEDPRPDAWERLVDELLARPQYGERWARHWLDIVRYAETNGYERDGNKPEAWRYRDYVIGSFNEDKPYDRFVLEQVAGDELPDASIDALIATGFYRLHVWDDEPDSSLEAEFDDLDDIMVTMSGAFLGMTMGCARCHDHKFDPISQREYYEMLAFFRSIEPHGLPHTGGGGRGTGRITRLLAPPGEVAAWQEQQQARITSALEALEGMAREDPRRREAEGEIEKLRQMPPPFPTALAVTEDEMRATHVLVRGRPEAPAEAVNPALPAALGGWRPDPDSLKEGGRRLALARWMASRDNPLTARVMVNRLWQHHFGRGLVPSPNDFGRTGEPPTHPELLDHLAARFMERGWSVKALHKEIMMSGAYRMSSRAAQPRAVEADEGNALFWRQNMRRLEGEAIRDSLLMFSGALNLKMGGPAVYPRIPGAVHGTQDASGKGWGESPEEERNRRSVYVFVKRALPLPLLEAFDVGNASLPMPRRPVTTVAPQALMLLNDDFVQRQAEILARRLAGAGGTAPEERIEAAFRIVLQRAPSVAERQLSLDLIEVQRGLAQAEGAGEASGHHALTRFCVALFNLNETIHVD